MFSQKADRELVKKIRSQRGIVVSKHRMNKGGHRCVFLVKNDMYEHEYL